MGTLARVEDGAEERGRAIIVASWLGDVVFAVTALPVAAGVGAFEVSAAVACLLLFAVSLGVWGWALVVAAARTTRGDDVTVTTLFLMEGRAPGRVRWLLYGSVAVSVAIAAASAVRNPFSVLVPMYPLGLVGLWGARHGVYPARRPPTPRSR